MLVVEVCFGDFVLEEEVHGLLVLLVQLLLHLQLDLALKYLRAIAIGTQRYRLGSQLLAQLERKGVFC